MPCSPKCGRRRTLPLVDRVHERLARRRSDLVRMQMPLPDALSEAATAALPGGSPTTPLALPATELPARPCGARVRARLTAGRIVRRALRRVELPRREGHGRGSRPDRLEVGRRIGVGVGGGVRAGRVPAEPVPRELEPELLLVRTAEAQQVPRRGSRRVPGASTGPWASAGTSRRRAGSSAGCPGSCCGGQLAVRAGVLEVGVVRREALVVLGRRAPAGSRSWSCSRSLRLAWTRGPVRS